MQTSTAPLETIEDALEEAIFKAGGILASNRGQPSKVGAAAAALCDCRRPCRAAASEEAAALHQPVCNAVSSG